MAAAAFAALAIVAVAPAYAGEWLADKSGCRVWDASPQLQESVTWSGSCMNGRAEGHGIARWSKAGTPLETDQGEWQHGRQVGKGTQTWSGGRYEGELAAGEPNGRGVLTLQKLHYDGEFRDGKPNGLGTLTVGSQSVHGTWKDGCLLGPRKASIGIPLSVCR